MVCSIKDLKKLENIMDLQVLAENLIHYKYKINNDTDNVDILYILNVIAKYNYALGVKDSIENFGTEMASANFDYDRIEKVINGVAENEKWQKSGCEKSSVKRFLLANWEHIADKTDSELVEWVLDDNKE